MLSDALVLGCVTSLCCLLWVGVLPAGLSWFEVEFSLGELLGLFALDTIANLLKWLISNVTTPSFVVDSINSKSPLSFMW